jgi:hypothetical protein
MKELIENVKFYTVLFIMTIGIWWWMTPLAKWPHFVPFLIGTILAIWIFFDTKKHPSSHAVGNGISALVTTVLLAIYVIGLGVSFFV